MTQQKFELSTNIPATITFKYSEPKTGISKGRNGENFQWYLYGIEVNGQEMIFFPSGELHKQIQERINRSKTLIITKREGKIGVSNVIIFEVKTPEEINNPEIKYCGKERIEATYNSPANEPIKTVWQDKEKRKDILMSVAFKGAIDIIAKDKMRDDALLIMRVAGLTNEFYAILTKEADKTEALLEAIGSADCTTETKETKETEEIIPF